MHPYTGRLKRCRLRKTAQSEVELNVAAMLDMAFQLLAFFILTFNPSDVETQITLFMPAKKSVMQADSGSSDSSQSSELDSFGFPLPIEVMANAEGQLASLKIGDRLLRNEDGNALLAGLDGELKKILGAAGFEAVDLFIDSNLNYDWMIRIVDSVTSQKNAKGEPLNKINIQQSK